MHQNAENKVIKNYEQEARMNFFINLDNFKIEIFKPQYDCLIKILNHISKYQRFQYSFYETRKYLFFRPEKGASKLKMFKYAIEMVIKRIQCNRGQFFVFELPRKDMKIFEENFMRLFNNYYSNPEDFKEENLLMFKKIIEVVDIDRLIVWTTNIVKDIYKKNKIEENKKQGNGLISKLFGVKKSDIETFNFTREEEEKIEEILKNSLEEMQTSLKTEDKELKFLINFSLESGFFKFSKTLINNNINQNEGFLFKFRNLDLRMSKCEIYTEVEASLKEFFIEMVTTINDQNIILPISFRKNEDILKSDQIKMTDIKFSNENSNFIYNIQKNKGKNVEINNDNLKIELKSSNLNKNIDLIDNKIKIENMDFEEKPIWSLKFKSFNPGNDIIYEIFFELVKIKYYKYYKYFFYNILKYSFKNLKEILNIFK